ncbi:MAG: hypothetical protein HC812_04235 [Leptolyngbya sp. RL_3_1]|nr:hypothetical protein [Leptolyngbya sp. RL_3_1]
MSRMWFWRRVSSPGIRRTITRHWRSGLLVMVAIAILIRPLSLQAYRLDTAPPSRGLSNAATQALSPWPLLTPLEEANLTFHFRGEPINPRAVNDLLPWLSDTEPGPVALDVEGSTADTNRYLAEVSTIVAGPWAGAILATWQPDTTRSSAYQWLGRLDNGLHVLRVRVNTGGHSDFTDLLMVRFTADQEYFVRNRERLVMTRVGQVVLGDGQDGSTSRTRVITLEGNVVVIPSAEGQSAPTRLDLTAYGSPH